jgi:site-specific DNA-methyltransferase (adenine-specific)
VVFSHSPDCQPNGTKVEKGHKGYPKGPGGKSVHWGEGTKRSDECRTEAWEGIPDQEVVAWECVEECAVLTLDTQTGVLTSGAVTSSSAGSNFGYGGGASGYKGDHPASSGGASRFFYCAKPAQKEKNAGLDNKNPHPTVKSVKLMRWLIRLITPPGGVVLDPFCGSGSTGIACIEEGFDFIGIEQSEEYATVAAGRIEYAERQKRISEVKAEREARHE